MLSWMALSFISDHATSFSFGFSLEHSAEFLFLKLLCCSSFECFSRRKKAWHMNGSVLTLSLLLQWHLTVIQLIFSPLTTKSTKDFFFKKTPSGQFSSCSKESGVSPCPALLLIYFFLHLLANGGKLPFAGTLPPVEMAFLVRCYANCLQPWSSKVSDVVIPFLASASGLGCCRRRRCVCVCYWERELGWGWEEMSSIHMHMTNIYFICSENVCMLCFLL